VGTLTQGAGRAASGNKAGAGRPAIVSANSRIFDEGCARHRTVIYLRMPFANARSFFLNCLGEAPCPRDLGRGGGWFQCFMNNGKPYRARARCGGAPAESCGMIPTCIIIAPFEGGAGRRRWPRAGDRRFPPAVRFPSTRCTKGTAMPRKVGWRPGDRHVGTSASCRTARDLPIIARTGCGKAGTFGLKPGEKVQCATVQRDRPPPCIVGRFVARKWWLARGRFPGPAAQEPGQGRCVFPVKLVAGLICWEFERASSREAKPFEPDDGCGLNRGGPPPNYRRMITHSFLIRPPPPGAGHHRNRRHEFFANLKKARALPCTFRSTARNKRGTYPDGACCRSFRPARDIPASSLTDFSRVRRSLSAPGTGPNK